MNLADLHRQFRGFGLRRLTYWVADPTFQTPSEADLYLDALNNLDALDKKVGESPLIEINRQVTGTTQA